MEKTGHYEHWETDFMLVKETGIDFLRYGPPYYKTHIGPRQYDWDFTDVVFNRLKELNITPIVDLCHFGIPDWMGNFQKLFAEYARAFAHRFPEVRLYTPINEIFIAAMFSAQYGWWNERLQSDFAFVTACVEWLLKLWANVHRLKYDGVPIVGFTWYSLLHQVDWDSALRNDAGHINELGLYDLNRQITPVGEAYKKLIHQWQDIINEESFGLVFHKVV